MTALYLLWADSFRAFHPLLLILFSAFSRCHLPANTCFNIPYYWGNTGLLHGFGANSRTSGSAIYQSKTDVILKVKSHCLSNTIYKKRLFHTVKTSLIFMLTQVNGLNASFDTNESPHHLSEVTRWVNTTSALMGP